MVCGSPNFSTKAFKPAGINSTESMMIKTPWTKSVQYAALSPPKTP